jgi:hypothetical protein
VILETLLQQKRQIQALETECNLLHHMVINLNRDLQFVAYNFRISMGLSLGEIEEEEIVHQLPKDGWSGIGTSTFNSWLGGSTEQRSFSLILRFVVFAK